MRSPIPAKPQITPIPMGPALENLFAENAEQNLRCAAAGSPADTDHGNAKYQRVRPHISQAFAILREACGFVMCVQCTKTFGPSQLRNTERRNDEGKRIEGELQCDIPRLFPRRPRNAPMVKLAHDVVWVIVFATCSSSLVAMVGRMEDRPLVKKGEANINPALNA